MMTVPASPLASIADGARPTPRSPRESSLPFESGDRWVGRYECLQGPTDLVILFEAVGHDDDDDDDDDNVIDVDAIFEFHFDGNGAPGFSAADGVSRMHGIYDRKTHALRLEGQAWIERPANYDLVTLTGTVNAETYKGMVEGPGCTSFVAEPEKKASPRLRPPTPHP